jgi:hypothetical protein
MSKNETTRPRAGAKTSACITAILLAAAAIAVIFGVSLAIGPEDTEPLESPLALSVARQLIHGPRELYGPYSGSNVLVMIHGPLYYHLAALLAWPFYRAGLNPVWAALGSGRALSGIGLVWTLVVAHRLARHESTSRLVGWWAVLLIAASPVVGVMPYAVRPDMLGVALQTTGVFLVLSMLRSQRRNGISLAAAFALFGLAFCVKQHYVIAAAISTAFLLAAWLRGRLSSNLLARVVLTGLTIVLVVYGTEELATTGMMSQSVFRAAASVSSIHSADWWYAVIVIGAIMSRSCGLIAVMAAAGLAALGPARGIIRLPLVILGIGLTGLVAAIMIMAYFEDYSNDRETQLSIVAATVNMFIVIPACYLLAPRALSASRIDRALWIYVAGEFVGAAILSRMSTGAWVNYGIQAVVFFSVLTARSLGRAVENTPTPRAALTIALAALVVVLGVSGNALKNYRLRFVDRLVRGRIFGHFGRPPAEYFFVGRPGDNRLSGRLDLVYDDWLYTVFEAVRQAEPRSIWLRRALTSGATQFVVNTSDRPNFDGLAETLPRLGYVRGVALGPYYVWRRSASIAAPRPR